MIFLNCNYPNKCLIPKGKPKGITPKNTEIELKIGKLKLIALHGGYIYFVENGYYFGIDLPRFIKRNPFGIDKFATIGAINLALLDWGDGRGSMYSRLSNEEENLLLKYLMTLR